MDRSGGVRAESRRESSRNQMSAMPFRVLVSTGSLGYVGSFLCKAQAGEAEIVPQLGAPLCSPGSPCPEVRLPLRRACRKSRRH